MEKITSAVIRKENGSFEHTLVFDFQGRKFEVEVVETTEETYVKNVLWVQSKRSLAIDIPKYFGGFSSEVYDFIYNNIQRGYTT